MLSSIDLFVYPSIWWTLTISSLDRPGCFLAPVNGRRSATMWRRFSSPLLSESTQTSLKMRTLESNWQQFISERNTINIFIVSFLRSKLFLLTNQIGFSCGLSLTYELRVSGANDRYLRVVGIDYYIKKVYYLRAQESVSLRCH